MSDFPKTIACMSIPRVGWNDAWGCVHSALVPWGIPIVRHNSCFWAEGLSRTFKMAMDDGAEWLLVIDYDSMFGRPHVGRLLEAARDTEWDAIACLQPKREHGTPLGCVDAEHRVGRFFKAESAHFGLTLLRAESLRRTPQPWLLSVPNKDGEWGDGRIDADLWFWNRWRQGGNTIAIDVENRIGHLEVVCVDLVPAEVDGVADFTARTTPPHIWQREFAV